MSHTLDLAKRDQERDGTETETIKGPYLRDILQNKEQSELFGEYLVQGGEEDLGKKLTHEALESHDRDRLAQKLEGFQEIMEKTKEVMSKLTPQMIKELAENSSDLRAMVMVHGPDSIQEALRRHINRLAVNENSQFETLASQVQEMNDVEEEIAENDKEIDALKKEYGMSRKELNDLLDTGDATAIAKEIHGQQGLKIFGRKKLADIKAEIASRAEDTTVTTRDLIARLNEGKQGFGDALAVTFSTNKTLHEALIADLRREKPEKQPELMSVPDMRTLMVRDRETEKAVYDTHFAAFNQKEKADALNAYIHGYEINNLEAARKKFISEKKKETFRDSQEFKEMVQEASQEWPNYRDEEMRKIGITAEEEIPPDALDDWKAAFIEQMDDDTARQDEAFQKYSDRIDNDLSTIHQWNFEFHSIKVEPLNEDQRKALTEKFEAEEWHDLTIDGLNDNIRIDLAEEFSRNYTAEKMKGYGGGLWSNIFSQFFRSGIFNDFYKPTPKP